jgi:hypothetical protein
MKNVIVLFFSLLTISCNQPNNPDPKNYEVNKKSILEKEQNNPKDFLAISVSNKKNIMGQTVVIGNIKNNALLARYKDIHINLYFYSKTSTLVDTEEETIYEQLFPGDQKKFKTKYFAPKGTDSVFVEISGAKIGD